RRSHSERGVTVSPVKVTRSPRRRLMTGGGPSGSEVSVSGTGPSHNPSCEAMRSSSDPDVAELDGVVVDGWTVEMTVTSTGAGSSEEHADRMRSGKANAAAAPVIRERMASLNREKGRRSPGQASA